MFGVGDDDQVIYGHAGADPAFLIDFEQLFPGAASHPLEVNYRCPVAVVDAAEDAARLQPPSGCPRRSGPAPTRTRTRRPLTVVAQHRPDAGARHAGRDRAGLARRRRSTRRDRRAHAGELAAARAPRRPRRGGRARDARRCGPRCSSAPGCGPRSPTCASPSHPDAMRPDDLQEVQRRPSRGLPAVDPRSGCQRPMSTRRAAGRRRPHRRRQGRRQGRAACADDLLRRGRRGAAPARPREVLARHPRRRSASAARWPCSTARKGGQSGSQLDDLEALDPGGRPAPRPRRLRALAAGCPGPAARPGRRAGSRSRPCTGSRAWSGTGSWSPASPPGVLPHRLAEDEEEERRVLHVAITRCRHRVVGPRRRDPPVAVPRRARRLPRRSARPVRSRPVRRRRSPRPRGRARRSPTSRRRTPGSRRRCGRGGSSAAGPTTCPRTSSRRTRCSGRSRPRRPTSARELATVDGIGPTKLELYGDEILAVLDATATEAREPRGSGGDECPRCARASRPCSCGSSSAPLRTNGFVAAGLLGDVPGLTHQRAAVDRLELVAPDAPADELARCRSGRGSARRCAGSPRTR